MAELASITISLFALIVSIATAWLTLFHRGTIKMTRPTQIFFGSDTSRWESAAGAPKIYLRSLMYPTSKRGRVVESMYVVLSSDGAETIFNLWVYGHREQLVRGSGLFVGEVGVEANHHFLLTDKESTFRFTPGHFRINVFASIVGDKKHQLLFSDELEVSMTASTEMQATGAGLFFDWAPDVLKYVSHVERLPSQPMSWDLSAFAKKIQ